MVDFRKWFPALAVVALAFGAASTASAEAVQAFSCVANAGNVPTVVAQTIDQIVEEKGNTNNNGVFINAGVNDHFANGANEKIFKVNAVCDLDVANAPAHGPGNAIANNRTNADNPAAADHAIKNNLVNAPDIATGIAAAAAAAHNPVISLVVAPDIAGNAGATANNVGKFALVDTPGTNATGITLADNNAANGAKSHIASYHHNPAIYADHPAQVVRFVRTS